MIKHENQKWTYRKNGTLDIGTVNNEPTRTEQHHKDLCDVNKIMAKFQNEPTFHQWFNSPVGSGQYADMSEVKDLYDMQLQIIQAQKSFETLPLEIRKRFDNDPAKLMSFLSDPKNNDESYKIGLRVKAAEVTSGHSETTSGKVDSSPESKS